MQSDNLLSLALPMLRLLSSKAQGHKDFGKPSKPWHIGIHCIAIAIAKSFQMGTHIPGFQRHFFIDKISHQQQRGKSVLDGFGLSHILKPLSPKLVWRFRHPCGPVYIRLSWWEDSISVGALDRRADPTVLLSIDLLQVCDFWLFHWSDLSWIHSSISSE